MKKKYFQFSPKLISSFTFPLILILFAAACHSPRDNDKPLFENVVIPDTVFSSPSDSLEYVFNNFDLTVNEKLDLYEDICLIYYSSDFHKSQKYALEGLEFAKKHDHVKYESLFLGYLAYGYFYAEKYDSAKLTVEKALLLAQKHQFLQHEASFYHTMGLIYYRLSDYEQTLNFYLKSLEIEERDLKDLLGATKTKVNIGSMYSQMDNNRKAEQYLLEAKAVSEENEYLDCLAVIYSILSNIYHSEERYEEGFYYAEQALELARKINDIRQEMMSLAKVASYYGDFFNDHEKAIEYTNESLRMAEKAEFPLYIKNAHRVFCGIYTKMGKYTEVVKHAQKALEVGDSTDFDTRLDANKHLTIAYINLGKKREAIESYQQVVDLMLKITDERQAKNLTEMEVKYETEKKELKISALEEERRLMIWRGIAGGVVLLLALAAALFLWRWAVQKKRISEQQHRLAETRIRQLEQEKQLVATQSVLDGETRERARLARDLHDGLGSLLTGAKLRLLEMKQGAKLEYTDVERFDKALELLDDSVYEMRRVAHHLMPDSLSRFGLKPAVSDFCSNLPLVKFAYYGNEERLDPNMEVMIYRSIHELVNNALKHAGAETIMVQIMQESDRIAFTVQDDGCGFDPSTVTQGMGLQNIRTRVASYSGVINIDSRVGEGTEINVELRIEN